MKSLDATWKVFTFTESQLFMIQCLWKQTTSFQGKDTILYFKSKTIDISSNRLINGPY